MATPNFETMPLEELIEWRINISAEIDKLKAEIHASNEVYNRKVSEADAERRARATGNEPTVVAPGPMGSA